MRDKSEKKPVTKSVRLTVEEAQTIQKKAEAVGLKESDYIRHKLTDSNDAVTPKERVSLQNIMNAAYTALAKAGASEKDIREFERECGKIW
ncbi:MAG: hypothetical protein K2J32_10800 [Ruminococcus sp.]|nr:hypothetical protein [Ruminococcus sp.]